MLKERRTRFAADCGRVITSLAHRPLFDMKDPLSSAATPRRRAGSSIRQNGCVAGRFAPSPTGDLHVGNLRTALVAWLAARSAGIDFIVRMEDLDRVTSSPAWEQRQLSDLAAIGLDWDGDVVRQSERFDLYRAALEDVRGSGRAYPCYCTRREIRTEIEAAVSAPHGLVPDGAYPGTCRNLTSHDRAQRERAGRVPAWRLRTGGETFSLTDAIAGDYTGGVDDFVLERSDGVPAYNLAVVIDDIAQGVTQVVRGDDLLSSTPRHLLLQRLVGASHPAYCHVPLVVEAGGTRLAKRDRAVTLPDLSTIGYGPAEVLSVLAWSLDLAERGERVSAAQLVDRFDTALVPRRPARIDDLFPVS